MLAESSSTQHRNFDRDGTLMSIWQAILLGMMAVLDAEPGSAGMAALEGTHRHRGDLVTLSQQFCAGISIFQQEPHDCALQGFNGHINT